MIQCFPAHDELGVCRVILVSPCERVKLHVTHPNRLNVD